MTTTDTESNPAPRCAPSYRPGRDPILRERIRGRVCERAYGGLHYIRGNSAPYFSLTWEKYTKPRHDIDEGGANHDAILAIWPELADLAAMHLSDIDGAPMHAEANGWYWLAGAMPDGFGEQYHGGNSQKNFPDGYRHPTGDECLQVFADHCRITLAEARKIAEQVRRVAMAAHDDRRAVARAECARLLNAMRPRWQQEAQACIAKHGLLIFGDQWPVAA